jgi:hypothetical protein
MQLGNFKIRDMGDMDAAFGAKREDYPAMEDIPEEHQNGESEGCKIFAMIFFNGGRLIDHGRVIRNEVDRNDFMTTLQALMKSFDVKHEVKHATCGWFIDEFTKKAEKK